jgi:7-cyano-7-deazaguanine synthase
MGSVQLNKQAILLSGGIDSAALAFWKNPDYAIHINYGQKCAEAEHSASLAIAKEIGIPLTIIEIDCSSLGSGDLSRKSALAIAPVSEWWPYRNQLLLTFAAMKAISMGINELLFGAVQTDKRHVDGTAKFFQSLSTAIKIQEGNISISTPAIELTSEELVRCSGVTDSILGWSHSCHTSNVPCGQCNGCNKHIGIKYNLGLI